MLSRVKILCPISFQNILIISLLSTMENTNARTLRSRAAKLVQNLSESNSESTKLNVKKEKKNPSSINKKLNIKKGKSVKIKEEVVSPVEIKSKYFFDQESGNSTVKTEFSETEKLVASPKKRKQVKSTKESAVVPNKNIKLNVEEQAIEDGLWKPDNWREVLDNILKMRKMYVAPVDSLGCEECPEEGAPAEVFRYQTLISVMLSSQTRDEVTYAATQRLIEHGLTVDNILKTSDEKIGELIYPAGFWKSKVKYIKNTSQILKDQYKGDIPRTFTELCKLPGVGPKMANIVMSVAWNDTVGIAVDTHVHRISNRLGWVPKPTKDPEQTRKALENWLPKEQWRDINVTLVGFGQTVCKPIGPSCDSCLNNDICPFGKSVLSTKSKKKTK